MKKRFEITLHNVEKKKTKKKLRCHLGQCLAYVCDLAPTIEPPLLNSENCVLQKKAAPHSRVYHKSFTFFFFRFFLKK